ncbi:hypothetical protein ACLB2K_076206 [Fragaria x ananassa]
MHRDPNVWVDPCLFQPERFLTTHKHVDVREQSFELTPFGSGRRICPGISLALQVTQLTLAHLLHAFDITPPSDEPVSDSHPSPRTRQLKIASMSDAIDLTGDGGVLKKVVRHAKPDATGPTLDLPLVDVHYDGILEETGEVFDTTHEDNTIFSFEIGKGSVIKAWDVALRTMKVGEIAKITCKPEYAYGSAGSPPDIPPDATLIFEVELVACNPRKGLSLGSASDERTRLEELKKQRELAAATKEEEKKKREDAKAAAAARIQAKLDAKKGGKGKGK